MNLVTSSLFQNTRIRANFGARPFMYAEGTQHRKAADECHDVTQDIKDTFGALPFHFDSDSDDAASSSVTNSDAGSHGELRASPGLPCRTALIPKSLRGAAAGYHSVRRSSLFFFHKTIQHFLFLCISQCVAHINGLILKHRFKISPFI